MYYSHFQLHSFILLLNYSFSLTSYSPRVKKQQLSDPECLEEWTGIFLYQNLYLYQEIEMHRSWKSSGNFFGLLESDRKILKKFAADFKVLLTCWKLSIILHYAPAWHSLPAERLECILIQEVVIALHPLDVNGESAVWNTDKTNGTIRRRLGLRSGILELTEQSHIYLWITAHTEGSRPLAANHRPPWLQSLQTQRKENNIWFNYNHFMLRPL